MRRKLLSLVLNLFAIVLVRRVPNIKARVVSDETWDPEENPIQSCVKLKDDFEVGWVIMPRDEYGRGPYVVFEFSLALDADNYFAFALSGHSDMMTMVGADVIAMISHNGMTVTVNSYKVKHTPTKCSPNGANGVCQDTIDSLETSIMRVSGRDVFVRLRRHLIGAQPLDIAIRPGSFQSVIWASGHWRQGPMYHGKNRIQHPLVLDFGDASFWTCTSLTRRENIPAIPYIFGYTTTAQMPEYSPATRTLDDDEATDIYHCLALSDRFEVGWKVQPNNETVSFRYTLKLEPGSWFAFGQSGSNHVQQMIGSAPVVLSLGSDFSNISLRHYYVSAKTVCQRGEGTCENEAPISVRWAMVSGGITTAHFSWLIDEGGLSSVGSRPLQPGTVPLIWATGPLDNPNDVEAKDNLLYHRLKINHPLKADLWQHNRMWNCSMTNANGTIMPGHRWVPPQRVELSTKRWKRPAFMGLAILDAFPSTPQPIMMPTTKVVYETTTALISTTNRLKRLLPPTGSRGNNLTVGRMPMGMKQLVFMTTDGDRMKTVSLIKKEPRLSTVAATLDTSPAKSTTLEATSTTGLVTTTTPAVTTTAASTTIAPTTTTTTTTKTTTTSSTTPSTTTPASTTTAPPTTATTSSTTTTAATTTTTTTRTTTTPVLETTTKMVTTTVPVTTTERQTTVAPSSSVAVNTTTTTTTATMSTSTTVGTTKVRAAASTTRMTTKVPTTTTKRIVVTRSSTPKSTTTRAKPKKTTTRTTTSKPTTTTTRRTTSKKTTTTTKTTPTTTTRTTTTRTKPTTTTITSAPVVEAAAYRLKIEANSSGIESSEYYGTSAEDAIAIEEQISSTEISDGVSLEITTTTSKKASVNSTLAVTTATSKITPSSTKTTISTMKTSTKTTTSPSTTMSTNFSQIDLAVTLGADLLETPYYGSFIGHLSTDDFEMAPVRRHRREIRGGKFAPALGAVYISSATTLTLVGFKLAGVAPGTYFLVSKDSPKPSSQGVVVANELGSYAMLGRYDNAVIVLQLPTGITASNLKWFAVWNRLLDSNLGSVTVPPGFRAPAPVVLGVLRAVVDSDVEGLVTAVNTRMVRIDKFSFLPPTATYFWTGTGDEPSLMGYPLTLVGANCSKNAVVEPLKSYSEQTLWLNFPKSGPSLRLASYLALYSPEENITYGEISLQSEAISRIPSGDVPLIPNVRIFPSFDGCEHLDDQFEVRWKVVNATHIQFHYLFSLNGSNNQEWVAFGLSPNTWSNDHSGADVWALHYDPEDKTLKVADLFECSGNNSRPEFCQDSGKNDLELIGARYETVADGSKLWEVAFVRKLDLHNQEDKRIRPGSAQSIVWATGFSQNRSSDNIKFQDPSKILNSTKLVDFGRSSRCVGVKSDKWKASETAVKKVFSTKSLRRLSKPTIDAVITAPPGITRPWPDLRPVKNWVFVVTLGPPGGAQGYEAFTGRKSAEQIFYVNGYPAPELIVRRFTEYLFYTATGEQDALYITTDSTGGYAYFSPEQRNQTRVFAVGKRCVYHENNVTSSAERDYNKPTTTFREYSRHLYVKCEPPGTVGVVHWTPNTETPDYVYYMSFGRKNVGWRIQVQDEIDSLW